MKHHTLLNEEHQKILIDAAHKKSIEELDKAIQLVRLLAPRKFLTDSELEKRVFHHQPGGMFWGGKAIYR